MSENRVFVGNVLESVPDSEIVSIFSMIGPITSVKRIQGKTFRFIEYEDKNCANCAVRNLNGYALPSGALLTVKLSKYSQNPQEKSPDEILFEIQNVVNAMSDSEIISTIASMKGMDAHRLRLIFQMYPNMGTATQFMLYRLPHCTYVEEEVPLYEPKINMDSEEYY